MTYTTTQIREFCDAFDRTELEYEVSENEWLKVTNVAWMVTLFDSRVKLRITPKPTPPVYEQWTDIKEVPLGDWYKFHPNGEKYRIFGVWTEHILLGGQPYKLGVLFEQFLHSPDPFAPDSEWMVCGRVK